MKKRKFKSVYIIILACLSITAFVLVTYYVVNKYPYTTTDYGKYESKIEELREMQIDYGSDSIFFLTGVEFGDNASEVLRKVRENNISQNVRLQPKVYHR